MSQAIQIGPLSLPLELLLVILVVSAAWWVGDRIGRKAGVDVERQLYFTLFIGVVAARLVFVLQNHDAYFDQPWSVIDIRDGGWSAWAGLMGAWLYALTLIWRTPNLRKPVLASVVTASAVWMVGITALSWPAAATQTLPTHGSFSMEGKPIPLSSYAGKPTVINLWATWCPPCRREMPVFERAQNENLDVNFVFLNQRETPPTIRQFLAQQNLSLHNLLLDPQGEIARMLEISGLPTTLFFNADGHLVASRVGELSHGTLTQRIGRLKRDQAR